MKKIYLQIGVIDFMLKDKSLTDFFNKAIFLKTDDIIHKMGEAPNMYLDLNDQTFRLNKIHEIKDYFIREIKEI